MSKAKAGRVAPAPSGRSPVHVAFPGNIFCLEKFGSVFFVSDHHTLPPNPSILPCLFITMAKADKVDKKASKSKDVKSKAAAAVAPVKKAAKSSAAIIAEAKVRTTLDLTGLGSCLTLIV